MRDPVIIGDATLYHGNTIDILPTLGECADLLWSDPPYKLTSGGAAPAGSIAEWQLAEDYNNNGDLVTCDVDWPDFMPLFYNCLRGSAHAYVMCNNRHLQGMLNAAEAAKFRFHNMLCWDKNTCTPNRFYAKNIEFVGFFFKGKAKYINDMGSKQLVYCPNEDYAKHPCSKPPTLCEYYIRNSSQIGETVIDPFLGAGACAIGALRAGRKFIGIELEEKWFNASVQRVRDFYEKPQQQALNL